MLGAAIAWGTAGVALASTAGGQSVPPPVTTTSPPGGFTTVVTSVTICPAGAVIGPVAIGRATLTITVPPGALPVCVQVTITAPDLADVTRIRGFSAKAGFGIAITLRDGAPYPGTLLKPVTANIGAPGITASSVVVVWNGSAFVIDPNATAAAGHVTIAFDSDPDFVVESPTVTLVPGATLPVTGKPFLGEGILAVVLVLSGTGAVALSRRRRARAASAGR